MIVKLLTEHHLEFLSLKVGCIDSSESTLVKLPHCWKSHVAAHISFIYVHTLYMRADKALVSLHICVKSTFWIGLSVFLDV